ncbi:hypothetical protein DL765_006881 [Monosporascus sp. GIB2]|nr:hypothetical protein DL765_006881 [Monosporascus sp. GIB2]
MAVDFGTASNHTVWRTEPTTRGTYGLLSSCVVTMILCVWTAVHLNLPDHDKPGVKYLPKWQTLRKVWWLLLGVFTPEIISWTAFEQHREAKHLHKCMRALLEEEEPCSRLEKVVSWMRPGRKPKSDLESGVPASLGAPRATSLDLTAGEVGPTSIPRKERRNKWTITHSFYVIMGGFAFDSDVLGRDMLPQGRKRVTLTSRGILELTRVTPHLLPDISVAHIKDKSKANRLAKTIVVLQASWFAAQCVSRMALGLTISLLELNTFSHALCALIAYWLWWQKPLDIEEPTLIEGTDADLVCAGLSMRGMGAILPRCGQLGRLTDPVKLVREGIGENEYNESRVHTSGLTGFVLNVRADEKAAYLKAPMPGDLEKTDPATGEQRYPLYMGQSLFGFAFPRDPSYFRKFIKRSSFRIFDNTSDVPSPLSMRRPYVNLSAGDVLRFSLAQQCYEKYPSFLAKIPKGQSALGWYDGFVVSRFGEVLRTMHRAADDGAATGSFVLGIFFAGLAYGGLHLLAWSPPVRTTAEVLMWRISGIAIIAYGVAPTALSVIYAIVET